MRRKGKSVTRRECNERYRQALIYATVELRQITDELADIALRKARLGIAIRALTLLTRREEGGQGDGSQQT